MRENEKNQKLALKKLKDESDKALANQKATLTEILKENNKLHAEEVKEMMKVIEKKNYEAHYPMSKEMREHLDKNPKSFNIQILGCRGAGKSTFVNKFMKKTVAQVGVKETTLETAFFNITSKVENIPERYESVFVVDQPGIGGLKAGTEAEYLGNLSPGKFVKKKIFFFSLRAL